MSDNLKFSAILLLFIAFTAGRTRAVEYTIVDTGQEIRRLGGQPGRVRRG